MTISDELRWNEPDAGCVTCGDRVLTIDDHRCSLCVGDHLRHCPHCLGDIAGLVNREVVRRLRACSWDVNAEWTRGKFYEKLVRWMRVVEARKR